MLTCRANIKAFLVQLGPTIQRQVPGASIHASKPNQGHMSTKLGKPHQFCVEKAPTILQQDQRWKATVSGQMSTTMLLWKARVSKLAAPRVCLNPSADNRFVSWVMPLKIKQKLRRMKVSNSSSSSLQHSCSLWGMCLFNESKIVRAVHLVTRPFQR